MQKLALDDELLLGIQQPARYIGGEINSVKKDPDSVAVRFAMCFPDVYEIGMSHLGLQILYSMFNRREDVYCERVFSPWTDLDRVMREKKIPLFTLESQRPVRECDFLGITLQYEMCYTNILQVLELSGIPLHAEERTEEDPLVIGGGPCTYNPEPIAPFFDLFYIGEGEVVYDDLLDLYIRFKNEKRSRHEFLRVAAAIPGIYVPSLYEVSYGPDGTLSAFTPKYEDVPAVVARQVVRDMDSVEYIEAHYMQNDLTLNCVAHEVGLSPTYFSSLFKKETGKCFSDYLNHVRIEQAKRLLCCTSKMIYEIAFEVGFQDYRYFSQIFKKYTGQTPRQFKNAANGM